MGFNESFHKLSLIPESYINRKDSKDEIDDQNDNESSALSDQEVLESTEAIYFAENVDTGIYELKVGHLVC